MDWRIVEVIEGNLDIFVCCEGCKVDDSDGEWGGGIDSIREAEASDSVCFAGVCSYTADVARNSSAVGDAEVVQIEVVKHKLDVVRSWRSISNREINVQRVYYRSLPGQNVDAVERNRVDVLIVAVRNHIVEQNRRTGVGTATPDLDVVVGAGGSCKERTRTACVDVNYEIVVERRV